MSCFRTRIWMKLLNSHFILFNCVFVYNDRQVNLDGDELGDLCDLDDDGDLIPEFDSDGTTPLDCDDTDLDLGNINDDLDCDGTLNEEDLDDDGDGTPEFDMDGITPLDCDDTDDTLGNINNDIDCDGTPADIDCDATNPLAAFLHESNQHTTRTMMLMLPILRNKMKTKNTKTVQH